MNWLTNYVRPKILQLVRPRDGSENLWVKCPQCGHMIFHKDLERTFRVCSYCNHHLRLSARMRLAMLFDDNGFTCIELPQTDPDPLKFRDMKRYVDRLREAQNQTGEHDAIIVAHGTMGGIPVVVAVFNVEFLRGSMGTAVGEGLVAAAELAILQEAPLVIVPAASGLRMQEGVLSLMQMARTTIAVDKVKEKGLPFLVVLTHPTLGGVAGSFAMLGDIVLAEPGAMIGFSGTRVVEQTMHEKVPEDFQRAEYLLSHGMLDMVVPRSQLRDVLLKLVKLLRYPLPPGEVIDLLSRTELPPLFENPPVPPFSPSVSPEQPEAV